MKKYFESVFSTKVLVTTAMLSALAYAVTWLEFPVFAAAPFLKLDFSNTFAMLGGFMFGPVPAVIIVVVKELIVFITKTTTGGVGEIANFLMNGSFVILPSLIYVNRKGIKTVIVLLLSACVIQSAVSLFANRFITFPLYMGENAEKLFNSLWLYVLSFNLIKSVANALLTLALYKRLSNFIKIVSSRKEKTQINNTVNTERKHFLSKSANDTRKFAEKFAQTLKSGDVVLLHGDLGAGKTVFVQGMANGLKISEPVTSPTYTYLNIYGGRLYHYDFYRIGAESDAENLGLTEYFNGENICVAEWSEKIQNLLPSGAIDVEIKKTGTNERIIRVK